jgi:hypothetical protein
MVENRTNVDLLLLKQNIHLEHPCGCDEELHGDTWVGSVCDDHEGLLYSDVRCFETNKVPHILLYVAELKRELKRALHKLDDYEQGESAHNKQG